MKAGICNWNTSNIDSDSTAITRPKPISTAGFWKLAVKPSPSIPAVTPMAV